MPQALSRLAAQPTMPRIELLHDVSRALQAQIQNGTLDVGVLINAVPVPDLIVRQVASDVFSVWGCPGTHAGAHHLRSQPVSGAGHPATLATGPSECIRTSSLELIVQLVAAGIGYGILPARVARRSPVALAACARRRWSTIASPWSIARSSAGIPTSAPCCGRCARPCDSPADDRGRRRSRQPAGDRRVFPHHAHSEGAAMRTMPEGLSQLAEGVAEGNAGGGGSCGPAKRGGGGRRC